MKTKALAPTAPAKQAFEGGATSSNQDDARYDLIPALARRFGLGAARHGENNWRQGGDAFRRSRLSHLAEYSEHGGAAIICNAAMLCHFEVATPFKGAAAAQEAAK